MTETEDRLSPTYLKRYASQYRVIRGEDGIWTILTTYRPRGGLVYDCYIYSRTCLAILLPVRTANNLLRDFPDGFVCHQDGYDAKVVLFKEKDLERFADRLCLRRRRRLSPEARERARETLRPYYFTARHRLKTALESTNAPSMG